MIGGGGGGQALLMCSNMWWAWLAGVETITVSWCGWGLGLGTWCACVSALHNKPGTAAFCSLFVCSLSLSWHFALPCVSAVCTCPLPAASSCMCTPPASWMELLLSSLFFMHLHTCTHCIPCFCSFTLLIISSRVCVASPTRETRQGLLGHETYAPAWWKRRDGTMTAAAASFRSSLAPAKPSSFYNVCCGVVMCVGVCLLGLHHSFLLLLLFILFPCA